MKDYYSILEMPLSFRPDQGQLKRQFYELSRKYHPDLFTMEDDAAQEAALLKSGDINLAYKVLSDEQARISYLLHFLGVLNDGEHEVLPSEFLMEIMEINETIFDLEMDFDVEKRNAALQEVEVKKVELNKGLNHGIDLFENQEDKDEALKIIKENFLKMKYMLRIQENLSTFASL